MMDFMRRLPELAQQKQSHLSVAQIAFNRKARRVAIKEEAERRVHLCEDHLRTLRQELSDAERGLQEVERNVRDWEDYLSEAGNAVDVSSTVSGFHGFPDNLSDSTSTTSVSDDISNH
jgi:gamma-glutamyl:cysteine ligase YbdK (ATP-grasp superfamily)